MCAKGLTKELTLSLFAVLIIASVMTTGCERRTHDYAGISQDAGSPESQEPIDPNKKYE